jgi:hypothetical protein
MSRSKGTVLHSRTGITTLDSLMLEFTKHPPFMVLRVSACIYILMKSIFTTGDKHSAIGGTLKDYY